MLLKMVLNFNSVLKLLCLKSTMWNSLHKCRATCCCRGHRTSYEYKTRGKDHGWGNGEEYLGTINVETNIKTEFLREGKNQPGIC